MFYNHQEIEKKWQKYWQEHQTFNASQPTNSKKPKYYVLDMFPYPSGAGLHVGHPLGYIASDIYARFKRHQGYNVLHPVGYDSFGLPAEQYAIQTGQHPAITTKENINRYEQQLRKIGFSFDWSRELRTSDASYYKWTQWIFIQLFHSWYNKANDRAECISTLVQHLEKHGTEGLFAAQSEALDFSAEQWKAYTETTKQEILLNYRMAYRAETTVNWCPALGTVLANDEVKDGKSERGGYPVFQKKMMQWSMRITAYSDRLLKGLEGLDWSEAVKESQRNWIGKSEGASVKFKVQGTEEYIEVFTTRPDTIFGVSFITLAPEHQLVKFITSPEQKQAVEEYIEATSKRSERERMADVKNISGVFTGAYAEHPITQEPIPIWLGDYVLAGYGTGAVMAVPCGDDRDYAFAQHFNISIKNIFDKDLSDGAYTNKEGMIYQNSDFLNGETDFNKATDTVLKYLESHNAGKRQTNYRQRDAIFSRQRYWGEPVPVYYEDGVPYTLPVSALPLELPEVEKYLPTEDGDPPLGNAKAWYWDEINQCVVPAPQDPSKAGDRAFPLELSTMPGWAGSSWYFLRYMDAHNEDSFCDKAISDYWGQVDLYIGGSEHATGHLLYSRFWTMFLYDRGFISHSEPFQKMINQGMILGMSAFVYRIEGTNQFVSKGLSKDYSTQRIHIDISLLKGTSDELDIEKFKQWRKEFNDAEFILEDGKYITEREVEKMSKSKYNVVNPDDICEEYGADCLRLYEMFLGPLEQSKPWNTQGLSGVYGFLKKFYNLYFDGDAFSVSDEAPTKPELKVLHTLIKKVVYDIEHFSFNTSVSQFMIAVNELQKMKCNKREILEPLAVLISPYAPHLCEELWSLLGHSESVDFVPFPVLNESYLVEDEIEYPVSFNGKMRFKLPFSAALSKEEIEALVVKDERVIQQLNGNQPKKIIVVPKKIINIVV
ncbi:leucine--tRNA ligase [Bergeyella cardium]|uniref:Leucine--tRNA ligase n=1 Tax=Bergeyella cardium TaxID=1585976 RepID=A0A6P1QTP5_9FLAO|nr:leucine--tRNA ligase [Bergeyella cardium]QHN65055.1 leucine--tRNA ligase [Bergeyella cardium]WHE34370.1 leucine--tRNA ligase [Bergeyella cardium]WHF61021.1 leucine--tRNA ligase [Bergeyella cardium]